jgi:hypothetical protein
MKCVSWAYTCAELFIGSEDEYNADGQVGFIYDLPSYGCIKINSKLKGDFVKVKSLSAITAIICISMGLSSR